MKKIYPFIFLLLMCTTVKSQYVQKITSINYYGFNGLNPSNLTVFNGKLYFFGTDNTQYVDKLMYTSDGTAEGIAVVKQIDSMIQYPSLYHLTILNNQLVFNNAHQLWKSDGTSAGTSAIINIKIGSPKFVILNNKIYFAGDITNSNPIVDQLWQSDGTAAGTTLVKTINSSGPAHIDNLFVSGGKIYFRATDGVNQEQLWISDGTSAGTMMLKRLNPTGESYPGNFIDYNGKVYFSGDDGVSGVQLWVTDGTTAGTLEITNINPSGAVGFNPGQFILFNSRLFFGGYNQNAFYQLWSTDGTTEGTVLVKADYTPRTYSGFTPSSLAVYQDKLYMSGYDSLTNTTQLWVTNGTTAGTLKVTNFAHSLSPGKLYPFQNKLVMTGNDTISNQEQIFVTDGTAAGTVCPTPPSTAGQYPFYPWEAWVPFNNVLYFKAAYSFWSDYQLCRYSEYPNGIENQTEENLTLYPNPTNGSLKVVLSMPIKDATIEVYNSLGLLVHQQVASTGINIIDLTKQFNGFYILKIVSGKQTIASQKIIKK